jgi:hypothetical protein
MTSKRIKVIATVGLVLGVAFGGARVVSAQLGGIATPVADSPVLATVATNNLMAFETVEKDGLRVYNIEDGVWSEYRAPNGTRIRPIAAGYFIAIRPKGSRVSQLTAYSEQAKGWVSVDLKEPISGEMVPIVSNTIAVYFDGHRLYAFSALASRWGVLDLPEGTKERPIVGNRVATITYKDHVAVFNAKFGRWDDSGEKPK